MESYLEKKYGIQNVKKVRHSIYKALLHYSEFKRGVEIPAMSAGYLYTLEEINAVNVYMDNIAIAARINQEPKAHSEAEEAAVTLYLNGYTEKDILAMRRFKDLGLSKERVNEWIWGSPRRDGIVSAMLRLVIRHERICPTCLHARKDTGTFTQRLTGRICGCNQTQEEANA